MDESAFMLEAIELAEESVRSGGGPFGAVVVVDGRVVGRGVNRVTRDNDPSAHAEVVAIRDACARLQTFRLEGGVLYATCEPCPMCTGTIQWARLERVRYAADRRDAAAAGFDDDRFWSEVARPVDQRELPVSERFLPELGARPFEAWARQTDRVDY
jgi:guanine deaminase